MSNRTYPLTSIARLVRAVEDADAEMWRERFHAVGADSDAVAAEANRRDEASLLEIRRTLEHHTVRQARGLTASF